DELLAGTALAAHQDARLRARGLLDDAEDPPHVRILRPQAVEELPPAVRLHVGERELDGPAHAAAAFRECRGTHPEGPGLAHARGPPEREDVRSLGSERRP